MKRGLLWLGMLSKRLLKKPGFVAILLLIPLLTVFYASAASQSSGVLTVALAAENPADPMARQVISDLSASEDLINFAVMTPSEARQAVAAGKADGAWILPRDMAEAVDGFLKDPSVGSAFVTVYQREDSVPLALAREKLNARLYECLSLRWFLQSIRRDAPELAGWTDEEILAYREAVEIPGELFALSGETLAASQNVHYLLSPVRGLLAVVMLLGGLAAAMYCIKDAEQGTFSWVSLGYRPWAELLQILVALCLLGAGVLAALFLAGIFGGWRELPAMALYILALTAFCYLLRNLLRTIPRLGAVIPVLLVVSLAVCPVFFDWTDLTALQSLLPPAYFIRALRQGAYLLGMLPYSAACLGLSLLANRLRPL